MSVIGKYEFPDEATFKALAVVVDKRVNEVVELGRLTKNYHADVKWRYGEYAAWTPYRVDVEESSHEFLGMPYEQNKIQDNE